MVLLLEHVVLEGIAAEFAREVHADAVVGEALRRKRMRVPGWNGERSEPTPTAQYRISLSSMSESLDFEADRHAGRPGGVRDHVAAHARARRT
ncbi:MAG: hypothetical protein U1F11_11055 [Steroidobacteraceae bacterium]